MHDVLDIIRNVQSLYAVGPTLGILKDFERVLDELDVYVFTNWEDGELLEGPKDSRHFVECSFMWPADKMPDPAGGKRLLDRGCKVTYKKDELLKPLSDVCLNNQSEEFCKCTTETISENYSQEDLVKLRESVAGGELPGEVFQLGLMNCAIYLGQ